MQAMAADRASQSRSFSPPGGVDFNPGEVVADRGHALNVAVRRGQPPVEHLGYQGLDGSSLSQSDIITSGLSQVNVATPGYLSAEKRVRRSNSIP